MTARSTFALFLCLASLGPASLAALSCNGSNGAPGRGDGASSSSGTSSGSSGGSSGDCGSGAGTFHCSGVMECPAAKVCCGTYDLTALTAGTSCQDAPCTMGQFCRTTEECPSGQPCTPQTCGSATVIYLCGVLSQAPYN